MWTPPASENGTDWLFRNVGRAHISSFVMAKINQSLKSRGQTLRVPGGGGSYNARQSSAHNGGKVLSLTHRLPLPPRKYSLYSFLSEAESTPGPQYGRRDYINDTIGNRNRHLLTCSAVSHPTALPRGFSSVKSKTKCRRNFAFFLFFWTWK